MDVTLSECIVYLFCLISMFNYLMAHLEYHRPQSLFFVAEVDGKRINALEPKDTWHRHDPWVFKLFITAE